MTHSFPLPGEWPCHRANGSLDAHSPLSGKITVPRISWQHFAGSIETSVIVQPGSSGNLHGVDSLAVPLPKIGDALTRAQESTLYVADAAWGLSPRQVALEDRLQPLNRTVTTTYAHVLPDEPGLQKLEFESAFNKPTLGGKWAVCVGRCFAWWGGAWVQVWETEQIHGLFHPLPLVGDFDADGELEVAILPWYELQVRNARTGELKDQCRFTTGRSYGFFGIYDLDGDGKIEFVIQSDFAKHVDVLGYRNGHLAVLWQRPIELDISNPRKVLRVGPEPVADVDGDGKLEVLVNLYNDSGDDRWHITIHDGITGAIKAELVDEHLDGVADVNGDGVAELLTTRTEGGGVPAYGPIAVRTVKNSVTRTLWEAADMGWQNWYPPLPDHVNSTATLATRTVLRRSVHGSAAVVLRNRAEYSSRETTLTVAAWDGDGFRAQFAVSGPQVEALALGEDGRMLAHCTTRPGDAARVRLSVLSPDVGSGDIRPLASTRQGIEPATVAVVHEPSQSEPLLVVQGSGEELVAVRAPSYGSQTQELWRRPGRGQATSWTGGRVGPVSADLRGDGRRQLLFAATAPSGCARLVAAELDGTELWHHDFTSIPGAPQVWNTGGIVLWQTGHFTDRRRQDVLVTVRRSMMHSEETVLLSGRDGNEMWRRERQISNHAENGDVYSRGVGGTPFAIADFDDDGLEDVASLYPSIFYILRGRTGEDVLAIEARWPQVPIDLIYFGQPVAGEWLGDGKPSVFFASSSGSMTGVLGPDGGLMWYDALQTGPKSWPAFGDFDGDGRPEMIGMGYWDPEGKDNANIRCYDTASGQIDWRLAMPVGGHPTGSASADLDGDGRDEALFSVDRTLYCLGTAPDGGAGQLRWQVQFTERIGPPSIADVHGSGQAAVLVAAADGNVYCIE